MLAGRVCDVAKLSFKLLNVKSRAIGMNPKVIKVVLKKRKSSLMLW